MEYCSKTFEGWRLVTIMGTFWLISCKDNLEYFYLGICAWGLFYKWASLSFSGFSYWLQWSLTQGTVLSFDEICIFLLPRGQNTSEGPFVDTDIPRGMKHGGKCPVYNSARQFKPWRCSKPGGSPCSWCLSHIGCELLFIKSLVGHRLACMCSNLAGIRLSWAV